MPSPDVKITILVDNGTADGHIAEHGLSFWIETEGKRVLFDTGQGTSLAHNARTLGVALNETDILILSHGHYDHTGGIPQVLKDSEKIEVFCHPGITRPRYSLHGSVPRAIQMPNESIRAIEKLPPTQIRWVSQSMFLYEKIGITGPIPRETDYEDTGGPFFLDPKGSQKDPIDDDLAIWIRTKEGLVVCAGCCHAGLINTLNHILRMESGAKLKAVLGGFHLLNADSRRLDSTMAALRSFCPEWIVPCHCTGEHAVAALKENLGERVSKGAVGMTYQF